jgi:hypothetical protein
MTIEEKYNTIKKIFWDYNIEKFLLQKVAAGDFDSIDNYDHNLVLNRMLERLSWYELLEILGLDMIKQYLTKENISKIRFVELREKYEFLRKVLWGEPISFTGWGDEYYSKIKHTLFSNRWYAIGITM